MTEDQMRDQFEEAYVTAGAEARGYDYTEYERAEVLAGIKRNRNAEGYAFIGCHTAWLMWNASRKAVCVELPFEFESGEMDASRVRKALDKVGVSYK